MDFQLADNGLATYTTIDGDVLDLIAFNFYGDHEGTTEFLLEANPGLAGKGHIYPAGIIIKLPFREPVQKVINQISLWD